MKRNQSDSMDMKSESIMFLNHFKNDIYDVLPNDRYTPDEERL